MSYNGIVVDHDTSAAATTLGMPTRFLTWLIKPLAPDTSPVSPLHASIKYRHILLHKKSCSFLQIPIPLQHLQLFEYIFASRI
jgi:hypothetical protein